jgi:hypothetical protein
MGYVSGLLDLPLALHFTMTYPQCYIRFADGRAVRPGSCINPSCSSFATIAAREPTPSLAKMRLKCVPTV